MSLLPHNELLISLSPHQVRLTRRHSRWRESAVHTLSVACVPAGPEVWSAPVAALENMLQHEPWNSGTTTVILSNHFVRYMLVPWSDLFLRKDEQAAYVRHLFSETYGELAARYTLRLSLSPPGKPRIASAVDTTLLERIRGIISTSGTRLHSIQPYLMSAFNEHRRALPKSGGWFVTVENGILVMTGSVHNCWQTVYAARCDSHWPQQLKSTLERLYLSGDAENIPKVLHWCSPEPLLSQPALTTPWVVNRIETKVLDNSVSGKRKLTEVTTVS